MFNKYKKRIEQLENSIMNERAAHARTVRESWRRIERVRNTHRESIEMVNSKYEQLTIDYEELSRAREGSRAAFNELMKLYNATRENFKDVAAERDEAIAERDEAWKTRDREVADAVRARKSANVVANNTVAALNVAEARANRAVADFEAERREHVKTLDALRIETVAHNNMRQMFLSSTYGKVPQPHDPNLIRGWEDDRPVYIDYNAARAGDLWWCAACDRTHEKTI